MTRHDQNASEGFRIRARHDQNASGRFRIRIRHDQTVSECNGTALFISDRLQSSDIEVDASIATLT